MACGQGAVLSHLDAAVLWRIYAIKGTMIHVTTTTRSGRRPPGIKVHRARRMDPQDITKRNGIPVTTVARTLVDLTDLLPSDRILRAMREAEYPFSAQREGGNSARCGAASSP
jgi:predicted transcriptional regulator of viral defense system